MGLQVEINGVLIELYKDEGISLVKKAIDYEKIGTSWSPFSQSFNVPASKINNEVFQYYYNSDVINGFNPFGDNKCRIYVDSQLQAEGSVRIVDIKYRNNLPSSYNIQVFSDNINLKESLKGKTIADLDWSSYNHQVTVPLVGSYLNGAAITGAYAEDLFYPFVSIRSLLRWDNPNNLEYKEGVSFASAGGDGILFDEFRPAAPFSLIVRELFNLSGFEVDNRLIGDPVYDKAYLWLNNSETLTGVEAGVQTSMAQLERAEFFGKEARRLPFSNEVYNDGGFLEDGGFRVPKTETYVFILRSIPVNNYIGYTYRYRPVVNGVAQGWTNMTGVKDEESTITVPLVVDDYVEFEFESISAFKYVLEQWSSIQISSQSAFVSNMVVSKYVPKLDATVFLQGVLDMFDAILYYDGTTGKFVMQNRVDWLNAGTTIDISEYIDTSSKTMRPPTFFNTLEFEMGTGNDISSQLFKDVYQKNHGTTTYTVGNVYGETFKRTLPFTLPICRLIQSDQEDASAGPQYTKNLVTTTCVDKSYEPVNPNAFIFIKEGTRDAVDNWKIRDYLGNTYTNSNSNDFRTDTAAAETISFATILSANGQFARTNTLFLNYYSEYINSLYGQDIRRLQFNAYIPLTIVSYIQPNDVIEINLKKYIIEDMTTNTLTGKTVLNLITK